VDMSSLHPNITVTGAKEAIAFYQAAFGAELVDAITAGDTIIHSDLKLGTSTFTVAEAFPGAGSVAPDPEGPTSSSFTLPVHDTDAAYGRAIAAGAVSVEEPADWFEGFRQAAVRCPFGHRGFFATVADSVTAEDVQRASDAWVTGQTAGETAQG
jgi:PhnB protein